MTLPEATHDTSASQRQDLRMRAGKGHQSTFCPLGERRCQHFYLDPDVASRKAAYCPRCKTDSEDASLKEYLRSSPSRKEGGLMPKPQYPNNSRFKPIRSV
jgi:hypothetical protein